MRAIIVFCLLSFVGVTGKAEPAPANAVPKTARELKDGGWRNTWVGVKPRQIMGYSRGKNGRTEEIVCSFKPGCTARELDRAGGDEACVDYSTCLSYDRVKELVDKLPVVCPANIFAVALGDFRGFDGAYAVFINSLQDRQGNSQERLFRCPRTPHVSNECNDQAYDLAHGIGRQPTAACLDLDRCEERYAKGRVCQDHGGE